MSGLNKSILDDIRNDDDIEKEFPGLGFALAHAPISVTPPPPKWSAPPPPGPHDGYDHIAPPSYYIPEPKTPEEFMRDVLRSLQDQPEYQKAREELSDPLRDQLDQFVYGTPLSELVGSKTTETFEIPVSGVSRSHFEHLEHASMMTVSKKLRGDAVAISAAEDVAFANWGKTVSNTPKDTYVPKKVSEVQSIVRAAKAQGKRVRAAGYRHTWSNMYSENDQVLISMLNLGLVNTLPNPESIQATPNYGDNEFKTIELAVNPTDPNKALVRLGAAVTNEDFRRWVVQWGEWTLALNVIMVEITFGGSNAPICHGAGIQNKTLSDLVRQIEYIDANGEKQVLSDPELLKVASGCFGLLGIVTYVTLEVDKLTYAMIKPARRDLILAIPPPDKYVFPPKGCEELQKRLAKYKPEQLSAAREQFIRDAEDNYYCEWFWFPYQKEAFLNIWNNTSDSSGCVDYPGSVETFIQWSSSWAGEVMNQSRVFRWLSPRKQAFIMGTMAMATLPRKNVKTQLINALHFRRGIQNMRVGDFEVEIPIPSVAGDATHTKRDWTAVQRAWWDGICAMYVDSTNVSARIALEMRVMADSSVVMAPQRGNTLGTASIEVITNMPAVEDKKKIWDGFKQTVANVWTGYKGPDGEKLNVRPHWAKEWETTKVDGKDWVDHMKEVSYKDEIVEFKRSLAEIGDKQGWKLEDLKATFSTPLLDRLIFD